MSEFRNPGPHLADSVLMHGGHLPLPGIRTAHRMAQERIKRVGALKSILC